MRPYELIKLKRDGGVLDAEEIGRFIGAYTRGEVPDYQMAALCMAVFFRGLTAPELSAWTKAMLESGEVLDLSDIPGCKVDKHSTGGVGDKVSLALAPLAAACGLKVPMISGRGLGHTGGTLDKLESIPGFRVDLSIEELRVVLARTGACLVGQTATLAPADKKLYALRDVTATVDCIPLIASSIMSKKVAEGIDGLVLDVKVGSGAFMRELSAARELAQTMVEIGRKMGKKVAALVTDMDQPLGRAVGNALEVTEAVAVLKRSAPEDLTCITVELTAEMLLLGGVAEDIETARARVEGAMADGTGLSKLAEIVRAQGGDPEAVREPLRLPTAKLQSEVRATVGGYVARIDTERVGLAAMGLGAGRDRVDGAIDPAVGFVLEKKVGDKVDAGEAIARLHANDQAKATVAADKLRAAYTIAREPPPRRPLVVERIA